MTFLYREHYLFSLPKIAKKALKHGQEIKRLHCPVDEDGETKFPVSDCRLESQTALNFGPSEAEQICRLRFLFKNDSTHRVRVIDFLNSLTSQGDLYFCDFPKGGGDIVSASSVLISFHRLIDGLTELHSYYSFISLYTRSSR